jgi:hypothetical protein
MPPRGAQSVNKPRMNLQHHKARFLFLFLSCVNTVVPRGHKRHCIVKYRNIYITFESEIIYRSVTTENTFDRHRALWNESGLGVKVL